MSTTSQALRGMRECPDREVSNTLANHHREGLSFFQYIRPRACSATVAALYKIAM
jgi:hypothetical protein